MPLGSLGFRVVRVLDSPTCWGCGTKNPKKFASLICHPRKLPKTLTLLECRREQFEEHHPATALEIDVELYGRYGRRFTGRGTDIGDYCILNDLGTK